MKTLLTIPLMAAMIGCAAAPEQVEANKAEMRQASQQCLASGGLPVTKGNTDRANGEVICADEHMMAMWREQAANCARLGGTPSMYGKYRGMRVMYYNCQMPYKPFNPNK